MLEYPLAAIFGTKSVSDFIYLFVYFQIFEKFAENLIVEHPFLKIQNVPKADKFCTVMM